DGFRADANRDHALGRKLLERGVIRRAAPRCGKARIDKRSEMPALPHHQRELCALGFPFGAEALLQHPFAEECSAVRWTRLIDAAAFPADTMRTPHARQLVEICDCDDLAA